MPTLLRMPDELYEADLKHVVCPHHAYYTLRDALHGYPSPQPAFMSHLLDFLARHYNAPEHLMEDAFQELQKDLAQARVLIIEDWVMIRAYHWLPPNGEHEGRWTVPGWVFAEHRAMLQLALDNVKRDVPSAGARKEQATPAPKVPLRKKRAAPAPTSLRPGDDLVDRMAQHSTGAMPLSPEESIQLRKDLGSMNQQLNPGEQFMVADYSADEQAYLEEQSQTFANDVGMVLSPPSATFGLPTRWATGDESRVAGAVQAGMAIEGVAGIGVVGAAGKPSVAPGVLSTRTGLSHGGNLDKTIAPSRTIPSGKAGSSPRGAKAKVDGTADQKRSYQRENESAEILAKAGYNVEQNPAPPDKRPPGSDKIDLPNPDLKIEGKYADVYSPKASTGEKKIFKEIYDKSKDQASRIVLNLSDSQYNSHDIASAIDSGTYRSRLKYAEEIIVIDSDNSIHHVYP